MKKENGITLTSVIIYVMVMAIVVGIIGAITSFFYTNVIHTADTSENIAEYNKFNVFFLEEVKTRGNDISVCQNHFITFSSGNTYTFQDGSIYKNNVVICKNITSANFSNEIQNGKKIVVVKLVIGQSDLYEKTTKYVLI